MSNFVRVVVFPKKIPTVSSSLGPSGRQRSNDDKESWRRSGAWLLQSECCCFLQILGALGLIAVIGAAVAVPLLLGLYNSTGSTFSTSIATTNATTSASTTSIITSASTTSITTSASTTSITTSTNTTSTATTSSSISTTTSTTTTSTTTTTTTTTMTTNVCINSYMNTITMFNLNMNYTLYWTQYKFNYTAPNIGTMALMFSFRNDPSYWYLDDVFVSNSTNSQVLTNGNFETGTLSGWVYCNPYNANYSGIVDAYLPHLGQYSYDDGSVGNFDYLSQSFTVKPGSVYTITFWLSATGNNTQFALISLFY